MEKNGPPPTRNQNARAGYRGKGKFVIGIFLGWNHPLESPEFAIRKRSALQPPERYLMMYIITFTIPYVPVEGQPVFMGVRQFPPHAAAKMLQ
jgi:hypothetical protein